MIEIKVIEVDLTLVVDMGVLILEGMTTQIDMNVMIMAAEGEEEEEEVEEEEKSMVEDLVVEKEDHPVMKKVKIMKKDTTVAVVIIMTDIPTKEEVVRDVVEMNGMKKRMITLKEEIVDTVVAKLILHLEKIVVVEVDSEEVIVVGLNVAQEVDLIEIQTEDLKEAVIEVVLVVVVVVVVVVIEAD